MKGSLLSNAANCGKKVAHYSGQPIGCNVGYGLFPAAG